AARRRPVNCGGGVLRQPFRWWGWPRFRDTGRQYRFPGHRRSRPAGRVIGTATGGYSRYRSRILAAGWQRSLLTGGIKNCPGDREAIGHARTVSVFRSAEPPLTLAQDHHAMPSETLRHQKL